MHNCSHTLLYLHCDHHPTGEWQASQWGRQCLQVRWKALQSQLSEVQEENHTDITSGTSISWWWQLLVRPLRKGPPSNPWHFCRSILNYWPQSQHQEDAGPALTCARQGSGWFLHPTLTNVEHFPYLDIIK